MCFLYFPLTLCISHTNVSPNSLYSQLQKVILQFCVRGARILGARSPGRLNFQSMLVLSIELFHFTILAPRILSLFLDFWKICEHVVTYILMFTVSGRNDRGLWPCVNRSFLFERSSVQNRCQNRDFLIKKVCVFFSRGRKCHFRA